jgi:hypothetical protein
MFECRHYNEKFKKMLEGKKQNGEKWEVKTKRNGDELLIEARR